MALNPYLGFPLVIICQLQFILKVFLLFSCIVVVILKCVVNFPGFNIKFELAQLSFSFSSRRIEEPEEYICAYCGFIEKNKLSDCPIMRETDLSLG